MNLEALKYCDREVHTLLCNLAQKNREFLKDLTILDSKLVPGNFRNAKAFSDIMVTKTSIILYFYYMKHNGTAV